MRPESPNWLDKIKFITAYAWQGCEAPFSLYVEYSQAPAGRIALLLLTPDLGDIIQDFFKPAGLRSKRHGRKGRRSGAGGFGVPGIDEMIARRLPQVDELNYRKYGFGTAITYEILDTIDRVSWTIAVIEMSTDLVFETLWGIVQANRDNCSTMARSMRTSDYHSVLDTGMSFQPLPIDVNRYTVRMESNNVTQFYWDNLAMNVSFAANFHTVFPGNWQLQIGIRNPFDHDEIYDESNIVTISPGDNVQLSCSAMIMRAGGAETVVKCNENVGAVGIEAFAFSLI